MFVPNEFVATSTVSVNAPKSYVSAGVFKTIVVMALIVFALMTVDVHGLLIVTVIVAESIVL